MDLEQKAIERVKTASEMSLRIYGRPLVVTDSGGKDSAVCREIVRRAGIPFELHHNPVSYTHLTLPTILRV